MRRLVDYDSSSSSSSSSDLTEEDRTEDKEGRRTDGPPSLPPDFADLYAVEARRGDDPVAFHDGRRRQVGHVAGRYPVHVFLSVPSFHLVDLLPPPHGRRGGRWKDLGRTPFGLDRDLHVSLTRPVFVAEAERRSLHASIHAAAIRMDRFTLRLGPLDTFANDDGTRQFLVVRIRRSGPLDRLVRQLDDVPALHGTAGAVLTAGHHHISLAWSPLPRPVSSLKEQEQEEEEETRLRGRLAARLADITIDVSCVKLKIGSTITSIHLAE